MTTPEPTSRLPRLKKWRPLRWGIVAAATLLVGLAIWFRAGRSGEGDAATFVTRRGPLDISVLEGGSMRAVESQEVKCEVRVGYNGLKILKIVDEGYEVTEDDIKTNKVLVELDSSDLQKQIVQQDIQYESAAATLIDAQQAYEIQLNQNLSDLQAAEQKVRFARLDFDKFLGDQVTQTIVDQVGLEKQIAMEETTADARLSALSTPTPSATGQKPPDAEAIKQTTLQPAVLVTKGEVPIVTSLDGGKPLLPRAPTPPTAASRLPAMTNATPPVREIEPPREKVVIDFSKYASIDALGDGEAKQKVRKFEDDLQVAQKEMGQAKVTLEGTKRLFEKGFVTKIDMEKDDIAYENNRLKVQTAGTARELFLKYEFPKTAEENLSKHSEAVREFSRARKAAVSKLAQAEAKLKSAQGQFNIQSRQRKELNEQLEKCVITAKKPGLVVYGGSREDMFYYGGEERVREGATVRERQTIITIPDMTKMSVRVKIHETYIKKIKKGQKARITVDAFPDKVLDGEVTQVGVLPDSQNMWMNPDMKVYLTTITVTGTHDWLKPGMSSKVEILVNRLGDVVYVPVQAVSPFDKKQVCFVGRSRNPERRIVEVGEFNDEFIEVKSGLKEGERVLLRAAETQAPEKTDEKKEKATEPQKGPGATPMPAQAAKT